MGLEQGWWDLANIRGSARYRASVHFFCPSNKLLGCKRAGIWDVGKGQGSSGGHMDKQC